MDSIITKLGLSSICLLEEKQYALIGCTRLRKTNTELSIASKVAWWQMDIPRNQESTIMTLFVPVGDKVILRFVLSFALHLGYELLQLDIDTSYLSRPLKETIYMIQPESFDDGSGRVCLLKKCIYSLKQSEREWYFRLSYFLKSIGFKICPKEPCWLVKDEVLLFIYVGDILVMSKT